MAGKSSSKDFACRRCKETSFTDVTIETMICKSCKLTHKKDDVEPPFVVHMDDMLEGDFKKEYCSNCSIYSICWSGKCYTNYYYRGEKIFLGVNRFNGSELTSEKFREFSIKNLGLLLTYAAHSLDYDSVTKTDKLKTLEDFIPPLHAILEKVGNNLSFLSTFFLDGWHLKEKSAYQSGYMGAFVKAPKPTKPVLFIHKEEHS